MVRFRYKHDENKAIMNDLWMPLKDDTIGKGKIIIIERIKQMETKNIFLKIVLSAILVVILIFYFKAFFTKGAYFGNTFLVKSVVGAERHYTGKNNQGGIHITVKGLENKHNSADVIYRLPVNVNRQYTVSLKNGSNWNLGIENIKDKDGIIIFEGEYKRGQQYMVDRNGKPLFDFDIRAITDVDIGYDENYIVPPKNVADFVFSEKDTIRGEFSYLIYAIIIFLITWIDFKYPLFFFKLKYWIDVEDPQPSEFYLTMQKISYVVVPIIGIVLMIAAIY